MFLNRERELAYLDEHFSSDRAEFLVVTGRRRVGKTSLLAHWAVDKPGLSFQAHLDADETLRREFSALVWQASYPDEPMPPGYAFPTWGDLFERLGHLARKKRFVVIIDEYPFLEGGQAHQGRVASILQKVWDQHLQHTHIMLILCGSYLSVMYRTVLDRNAPLHGRRTGQILLQPFTIDQIGDFLSGYTAEQLVETYAMVGGMPAYLAHLSADLSLWENMARTVLNRDHVLYMEPDLILREELREPRLYAAILRAIAEGRHQLKDIAAAAGFTASSAAVRYLDTLQGLGLVERRIPVPPASRPRPRGAWHIADPYLRFWARWTLPHATTLTFGQPERLLYEVIRPGWEAFVGAVWEDLARYHLARLSAQGHFPHLLTDVGAWWSPHQQIDLVGVNRRHRFAVLGEAGWRRSPMGLKDLAALKERERAWLDGRTDWLVHHVLYSRRGFTAELAEQARQRAEGLLLFTSEDVVLG
ncbi:MAG: ATP-binding protein [Anaerolineae bacterium]